MIISITTHLAEVFHNQEVRHTAAGARRGTGRVVVHIQGEERCRVRGKELIQGGMGWELLAWVGHKVPQGVGHKLPEDHEGLPGVSRVPPGGRSLHKPMPRSASGSTCPSLLNK